MPTMKTQENSQSKLEEAIKTIRKTYGAGAVMAMNDSRAAENIAVISTGNTKIDALTGVGGIPRGRITEVFGPESGGKTTLCLQVLAQAQKLGGLVAYIDAEQALNRDHAAALGVDTDKMLISQPTCGEEALDIALLLIQSGGVMAVVVDSVAALVPRSELEGDMGDAQMGVMGRMMGQAMRKINGAVATTGSALIFVNQIRDKLGVMFGNPETTPGGRSLKFYASLRLDLRRVSQIKKGDSIVGAATKVKTVKNKMAPPLRTCEVNLMYGKGFVNE